MDYDYIESELLEISSILRVLKHLDVEAVEILDIETLINLVSQKTDKLYCYIVDQLI